MRLTEEIVNLRAHHVPPLSCCQQLWIRCEHTAAQVGLPSYPTDKTQKSSHQRRLLGHFWGLDVIGQGQASWPRLPQYKLLEVLSWREKPSFELVVPDQIYTFALNDDSILPYTEAASDFQSETLTVFTVTSTNNMNKLVTHWTLVSALWLLTNHTPNIFVVTSLVV